MATQAGTPTGAIRLAYGRGSLNTGTVIEQAVEALSDRTRILVFTGAGISTESGIPDYRGPQGLWKRFDPSDYTYDRYVSDPAFRIETWGKRFHSPFLDAAPNDAHRAVTRLWDMGRLVGVVTQNIDGLHAAAGLGPESLVEVHGNARRIHCIACGNEPRFAAVEERWEAGAVDPECLACGGVLKTRVVYFGEQLPQEATIRAWGMAEEADAVLVIGSTLSVYPAAFVPLEVIDRGHPMVIVNRGRTDHDARATALVDGAAGTVVPALADRLAQR